MFGSYLCLERSRFQLNVLTAQQNSLVLPGFDPESVLAQRLQHRNDFSLSGDMWVNLGDYVPTPGRAEFPNSSISAPSTSMTIVSVCAFR